jgi:hypothetical protein
MAEEYGAIRCDMCDAIKKETNHWFRGLVTHVDGGMKMAWIAPFDAVAQTGVPAFCGEGHALKWLSTQLSELHGRKEDAI